MNRFIRLISFVPNQDRTQRARTRALRVAGIALPLALVAGVALASGGEEKSQGEVLKEMAWQTANLALLLGVLFYYGRKPITEFFATRRSGIQTELSQAAELLAEAEQRNAELQRRLVDLNSEIDGIKKTAGQRAGDEADRILADARAAAERIRNDARAAMDQELRRAQSELREEAADLALELAAKKLEDEVGEGDRDRLVDEFILRVEPGANEGASR
jgi:F-type H+-transporting ATPase subunit b